MKRMMYIVTVFAFISSGVLLAYDAEEIVKGDEDYLLELIMGSSTGDTIHIPSRIYLTYSTLTLTGLEDVCILFEPGAQILLGDAYLNVLELRSCSDVSIINGYFRHAEPLPEYDCHGGVICLDSCFGITVDNCTVSGCGAIGIRVDESGDIVIRHCLIEDNSFSAFYLNSFEDLDIMHCIVRNNGQLFYSSGREQHIDLHMRNNIIHDNNGLYFDSDEIPGLSGNNPDR